MFGGDVAVKVSIEGERLTANIAFIWAIVLSSMPYCKDICRLIRAILTDEFLNFI
jgi:hypothetical protein